LTVSSSFLFLTPKAAFLVLLAVVPLAALALGGRRTTRIRRMLGLAPPPARSSLPRIVSIVALAVLLALAAMQPAIRTQTPRRQRTDAQAFIVIDTSRSMAARPSSSGASRLQRAKQLALAIGPQLGDVPVGVATFTDRVLPDLFPTSDRATYDSTVSALGIEDPPPEEISTVATTFDALQQLATAGFFPDSVRKRAVVLITDGESRPFDPAAVARTLANHGVRLALVRVGSGADRVLRPNGTPEANFRPDPRQARTNISRLAAASQAPTGTGAAQTLAAAFGTGPSNVVGVRPHLHTLAPLVALLALVPLAFLLGGGVLPRLLRGVTFIDRSPRLGGQHE
jgi:hypothetical protein